MGITQESWETPSAGREPCRRAAAVGGIVAGTVLAVASTPAFATIKLGPIEIQGFLRLESAFDISGEENPNNQNGNVFNDQVVSRDAYVPPALAGTVLIPGSTLPNLYEWDDIPFPGFQNREVRRGDEIDSTDGYVNYSIVRLEAETSYSFTNTLTFTGRVRALYDPDFYDSFDAASVQNINGGIVGGEPDLYHGEPYLLGNVVDDKTPNPLEWSGRDYMVDLPTLVLTYSKGPLNVRIGNQAIAWGQALFFRAFDVPQGLDFRRHLFVDRGLEEYADERVSSLAVRLGYQFQNSQIDAFVSKFQPNVLPNPNTPYNVVPTQFTIHDQYFRGGYDEKFSYGLRFKAEYGDWGWQAMAVRRWNPEGVFRWTESGVERPFQGADFGALVNTLYGVTPDPNCSNAAGENNVATALAHTGLSNEPGGIYSAPEFFYYAADARLDGVEVLNHLLTDLNTCGNSIGASPVPDGDFDAAYAEVDTFMIAAGESLRGHVAREYFQENVFGLGFSYVTSSSVDFLDQIIFNLEASYTPNRVFTDVGLSTSFDKRDDFVISLSADKWHRFTPSFPGMLLIAQAMYRPTSDLVGRLLDGYGGTQTSTPKGVDGVTYLVFGGQQPFPNRIWEAEFATLIDTRGGGFVQLGLRWNPGGGWHVEGYWNGTSGTLWGDNPNENLIGTVDFIDELMLRIGKEF